MKYNDVVIKPVQYIKTRGDDIYQLFSNPPKEPIPLHYQYAQSKDKTTSLPQSTKIGEITNIHVKDEQFVCDVIVHDLIKLAHNFDGVIDNYRVKVTRGAGSERILEFIYFIIYDKKFKQEVDEYEKRRK